MGLTGEIFDSWIPEQGHLRLGEIILLRVGASGFQAFHQSDVGKDNSDLVVLEHLDQVEVMVRQGTQNKGLRLHPGAPDLQGGWVIEAKSCETFLALVSCIYPDSIEDTIEYLGNRQDVTSLCDVLSQKSRDISDNQANQIMRDVCAKNCVKKIAWPIDGVAPISRLKHVGKRRVLICCSPCEFLVSEAERVT